MLPVCCQLEIGATIKAASKMAHCRILKPYSLRCGLRPKKSPLAIEMLELMTEVKGMNEMAYKYNAGKKPDAFYIKAINAAKGSRENQSQRRSFYGWHAYSCNQLIRRYTLQE